MPLDAHRPTLVAIAVALDAARTRTLLVQRRRGPLAGTWEWPGGKVELGETVEQAVRREWREEVGGELEDVVPWTFVEHRYDHGDVLLLFFRARPVALPASSPLPRRWVPVAALDTTPMPPANAGIVEELQRELGVERGAPDSGRTTWAKQ